MARTEPPPLDAPADADPWAPAVLLPDAVLARLRERAARHDAEGSFPHDDLDELRGLGWLRLAVPAAAGGADLGLARVAALQARLAEAAPATALAVGMHLVWTGCARVLHDRGDDGLALVLEDAARDELFAFGVSEPGNDLVLLDSVTRAEPLPDGGYRFTGTKTATSLAPAWTHLGVFGRDDSDPDRPALVHGFVHREQPGHASLGDWDALGMRATQSHTTVLDGVEVPAARIVRRLPVGPGPDLLPFGILVVFETLVSAVYLGLARRALQLAVEAARTGRSRAAGGAPRSDDPVVRWRLAEAAIVLDGLEAQVASLAADVDALVDHGADWARLATGLKVRVTAGARAVVDQAVTVAGGASYRSASELGRLQRDVLAGRFHPSSTDSAHATAAASLLGPPDQG